MTTILTNAFRWAETVAEKIIALKDATLGILVDFIVPLPNTRQRFRRWFKDLLKTLSQPLSDKVDYWIETDVITVANIISVTRALAGPIFIISVSYNLGLVYYLILVVWAGFTDYFDGIIARKMNQQTETGAAIDAGCDKIFAFCGAISFFNYLWLWPMIFFFLFDGLLITMATTLQFAKRHDTYHGQAQIKSNWLGKVKYNLQAVALLSFIFSLPTIGNYALWAANAFALGSIIRHLNPKEIN